MADTSSPSLLLVDDDDAFRERLAKALRDRGYDVHTASDTADAVKLAECDSPEIALIDLRMPGASGLALLRELKRIDPATKVVVLTGYGSIATATEAMRLGATHYLTKPATVDEVVAAFKRDDVAPLEAIEGEPDTTPSLARAEWEHINRVLSDAGGNVSEAARRLNLHRRSLQRKLQKRPPNK
jgi:two-component system response regulator RegA